jgi:hypothetical protein
MNAQSQSPLPGGERGIHDAHIISANTFTSPRVRGEGEGIAAMTTAGLKR